MSHRYDLLNIQSHSKICLADNSQWSVGWCTAFRLPCGYFFLRRFNLPQYFNYTQYCQMFLRYRQPRGKKPPLHSADKEVYRWNRNEIIVPQVECICNTVLKKKDWALESGLHSFYNSTCWWGAFSLRRRQSEAEEKGRWTDWCGVTLLFILQRLFVVLWRDFWGRCAFWGAKPSSNGANGIFLPFSVLRVFIYSLRGYSCLIGAVHLSFASLGERRSMSRHTDHTHATVVTLTESFSSDAMWSDWWPKWMCH